MRRLIASLPLALLLAACSPAPTPPAPGEAQTAPANPALGSPEWLAWVDQSLAISDKGHGPDPGSPEWNQAVQRVIVGGKTAKEAMQEAEKSFLSRQ